MVTRAVHLADFSTSASPDCCIDIVNTDALLFYVVEFAWDPEKAADNVRNHRVRFEEATEVFTDSNAWEAFDEFHSEGEPRYIRIGLSSRRLLLVVFTEVEGELTWIISTRRATVKERKLYEET